MVSIFETKLKRKTYIYDSCLKRRTVDSLGKATVRSAASNYHECSYTTSFNCDRIYVYLAREKCCASKVTGNWGKSWKPVTKGVHSDRNWGKSWKAVTKGYS